ncbi:MAG TPA: hypothetical protein VF070_27670 [Streptosporangiaceae bacterium]
MHGFARHVDGSGAGAGLLFGSDWPHPEGIRQPADYLDALAGYEALVIRKMLRANTARLLAIEAVEIVSSGGGQAPGR